MTRGSSGLRQARPLDRAWTPAERTPEDPDLPRRVAALARLLREGPVAVLGGAGISTGAGIPDYRGPDSLPRSPMTYQQFVSDAGFRRRYWARNHIGWKHMEAARPTPAHRVLADWERRGIVAGVVTQNVDMLHLKAGSRRVVDLHGTYGVVRCLDCGHRLSRWRLHELLTAANPGFTERMTSRGPIEVAPDADAALADIGDFREVGCPRCSGVLKPDIVYFGETVPPEVVDTAAAVVDSAASLLVVGSTLTVRSGYRFVARAHAAGTPIAVVNRGATRADRLAALRVDGDCSAVLSGVDAALAG